MLKKTLVPLAALGAAFALAGELHHRCIHTYEITIGSLTMGQGFSRPVFFSHGAGMLGMTNDGFSGLDGVDTCVIGGGQTVKTATGWGAGTERNDERQTDLIGLMGPNRNPEDGVIHRHPGIRGNHAVSKKWDFHGPVARVTIKRVS